MYTAEYDFQNLYEVYQPKILRYMVRLVGEDEAEDLTQDVFIKASMALEGFRGESSLSTWLYRIATHSAYDRLRSPSFRMRSAENRFEELSWQVNGEESFGLKILEDQDPSVEQQIVKKELSACVLSQMEQMPERYRKVLMLSDVESFNNKEISEILGLTLDTVKIRLHRARTRMRELLVSHCEYYWISELSWRAG